VHTLAPLSHGDPQLRPRRGSLRLRAVSAVLSVGSGYDTSYLTDEVATGREGYYTDAVTAGEPAGLWYGAGAADLGLVGEVDAELMNAVYAHRLDPRDPAAHDRDTWGDAGVLGATRQNYKSADERYDALLAASPGAGPEEREQLRVKADASARQSVMFIDATFGMSKSISLLVVSLRQAERDARAVGDGEAAARWAARHQLTEDAIKAGARASMDFLQEHAGYSRAGSHSKGATGRWIDAHRWTVAMFAQHDNREHEPHSHVHCAILNVVECADGKWRTLDGTGVFKTHKAAAAAHGGRVTEAILERELGIASQLRPDGKARELVGVDLAAMDSFSTRTHQVEAKAVELTAAFVAQTGRAPNALDRANIRQQATLATRAAKAHDGETHDARQDRWDAQASTVVEGGLSAIAEAAMSRAGQDVARWSPRDVTTRALAAVAEKKGAWTRSDLLRCVDDALPGRLGVAPGEVAALLEGLTDTAMATVTQIRRAAPTRNLPAAALLDNGASPYSAPGRELYAAPGQVAAERALRADAVERGAVAWTEAQAAAVLARFTEHGRKLGADQAAAIHGVLTSGAQIEVLSAAAGTGKSYVVGALAQAWTDDSARRVFGLAPSQIAAGVLAEEGLPAVNTTRWIAMQARLEAGGRVAADQGWRLRPGDLVVLDEAGMTSTDHIAQVRRRCAAAGAKLLLVGDPRQLAAVGPGGAMADIAAHGIAYQLTEVRRFTAAWEREASLRLRDAHQGALGAYQRDGRLVEGGTTEQAETAAARAWLGDTLSGRESLLLVGTNEAAARVSAQLRAELVALGRVEVGGVPLAAQGTMAGVGDLVQTRRNAWDLIDAHGHAVANRDVWRVIGRDGAGGLRVQLTGGELEVRLPPGYVAEHVALAYASTVHAAPWTPRTPCWAPGPTPPAPMWR